MAQDLVGGPLGEGHLADQPWLHPLGAAGVRCGYRGREGAVGAAQRLQPVRQVGEGGLGEAGADMPGVPQPGPVRTPTSSEPIVSVRRP